MNKKLIHITCAFCILTAFSFAKPHAFDSDHIQQMLQVAESRMKANDLESSRKYCLEAMESIECSEYPDLQTRCALMLCEISNKQNDPFEALNYALIAEAAATQANSEYKLAAGLTLINCYNQLGLQNRSAPIAAQLIKNHTPTDDVKIALLKVQANAENNNGRTEVAIEKWKEIMRIAGAEIMNAQNCEALETLSSLCMERGDYAVAIEYEYKLLLHYSDVMEGEHAAICANNIGLMYHFMGQYGNALHHFKFAEGSLPKTHTLLHKIYLNKAATLLKNGESNEAFTLIDEAIALSEKYNDHSTLIKALQVKSTLLKAKGSYAEATAQCTRAMQIASEHQCEDCKLECLEILGSIAIASGDKAAASEWSNKILLQRNLMEQQHQQEQTNYANLNLAAEKSEHSAENYMALMRERLLQNRKEQLFAENADKDKAIRLAEQQLQKAELDKATLFRLQAHQDLAQAQLIQQNQQNEIIKLENEKNTQLLSVTQLQLEKNKQQSAIALLNKANEVLNAENLLKVEQSKKEKLRTTLAALLSIFILTGLVISVVAYRRNRQRSVIIENQNISINQANEKLQSRNNEIMNSINYASFFQGNIMPREEELREGFHDAFIHYRPLDIVSGDLPFYMEKNGNTFIAAIDCIGHGVPAAMLSFMVHYTLADLINENAELSAGDMMSQLNERMLDSLSREKSKNFNAAADMSLCKISACRTKLEYAGAGSPIIIQQGNVFTRIKAEPYSIADSVLNLRHSYKTTEIKLNTKDRVYLFTDGLAHQHGGNGKVEKFGYKKLAEHLKLKAGHALRDVKQSIVSSLEAWQGRQEQTDDIMILCVEI